MFTPAASDDRRRRRLIITGAVILLLSITVVTYAVLAHRATTPDTGHLDITPRTKGATRVETHSPLNEHPTLRSIRDPEVFARSVASAVFAWDTSSLVTRADHLEQLLAVADPTGESTVGLASDLDGYLPTPDAWVDLTQYQTRQWLTVASVTTPTLWPQAEAEAGDELLPGTTAYTIDGTRHRAGLWEGAPVESTHEVSFTVFVVCAPSYPTCHLLRLSMLDKPLD